MSGCHFPEKDTATVSFYPGNHHPRFVGCTLTDRWYHVSPVPSLTVFGDLYPSLPNP
jgi:hypothetical protein